MKNLQKTVDVFRVLVFGAMALLLLGSIARGEDTPPDYLLGDGDVLRVMVYDHPDLTTTARVSAGGLISFPLVGTVNINDMTVGQVAQTLAAKLADGYIVNPQVSVFIEEFRSKKAVIVGQITQPGLYELSGPTTLLELISKAGGLRQEAGDEVVIKRRTRADEEEKQITLDLRELLERGDASQDIALRDGDNIFIPEAGVFYVTGQVNKPAAYRLEKGTSVIKAITMAGGFTDLAATRKVKIIRKVEGREKTIENVSMHESVRPEDVVLVPESFF